MVEKRTENISVKVFSTSTHVNKPQILLQISNVDIVFELDTGADVSLVGPDIWKRIGSQRFRDKQRPEHAEKGQANMQPNRRGQKVCYRCGSLAHHHRDCPFIDAVCYGCDRRGHIRAVCRSSGKPV